MPLFCVATHCGSHSSHTPTSPMAASMRAIACHKRWWECHLSIDTSRVYVATIQTGHDMLAGLASLTQFCVVHSLMSVDFVSYTVAWGFCSITLVMCMHSLRLALQCPTFHTWNRPCTLPIMCHFDLGHVHLHQMQTKPDKKLPVASHGIVCFVSNTIMFNFFSSLQVASHSSRLFK